MKQVTFYRKGVATHVGERESYVVPGTQNLVVQATSLVEADMSAIGDWLWRVAVGKGLKRGVQALVAWLVAQNLAKYGVTLDPDALTLALIASSETGRNWLKHRFPKQLSWL